MMGDYSLEFPPTDPAEPRVMGAAHTCSGYPPSDGNTEQYDDLEAMPFSILPFGVRRDLGLRPFVDVSDGARCA
jgi:hypothetical protein